MDYEITLPDGTVVFKVRAVTPELEPEPEEPEDPPVEPEEPEDPVEPEEPVEPLPPLVGDHGYFGALVAHANHLASYSLRDPAQLAHRKDGGYANSNDKPLYVTYAPEYDLDPRRQDAAKIVIPVGTGNLPNQVRLPIPPHAPDSLFVTWDAWFGAEWAKGISGLSTHKAFQLASDGIHTEVRTRYSHGRTPTDIAMTDVRQYGYKGPNNTAPTSFGDYNYGSSVLGPMVGEFMVQAETWTRYFAFIDAPDAEGWWLFSLWVADALRDPVQILAGRQIQPKETRGQWDQFYIELNTSGYTHPPERGDLIAYIKNVAMLKALPSDVTALLVRPE